MRVALIADTHLSARSPECVANWHAARRAVERLRADLTVNLGDITLDGQTHPEELGFASRLIQQWPTEIRCVPGNHDLGDGSGELPLDARMLGAYQEAFGPDRWVVNVGPWRLLGINAQILGSGSTQELALSQWIEDQADLSAPDGHTALFLHRPLLRPPGELARKGRYVPSEAAGRLLNGPLRSTLRLVVSGHMHQYLDITSKNVRHLWMPSTGFILPDGIQVRIGEKLVGIGVLDFGDGDARFDLWCPEGMTRYDVSTLQFFRSMTDEAAATESVKPDRKPLRPDVKGEPTDSLPA
jgi:3',5'-cyclic AMP phosphodiesterase CpdA